MPKKLIIGISLALVLAAAAVFAVVVLRSRALQEAASPGDGTGAQTGAGTGLGSSTDGNGTSLPTGGNGTALPTGGQPTVPQEGPCGDGVCSAGESWCKPDCGTEEERFEGSIVASEATQTSLTIAWKTSEPSTGEVAYGTTDRYEMGSVKSSTPAVSHEVRLTGLSPGTTYVVRVRATDEGGTLWESEGLVFETPGR